MRRLTVWAVKHPPYLFAELEDLGWLDIRGGSGDTAAFVTGCSRLRGLSINQIRGLSDLTAVEYLESLEFLSIYGEPRVRALPDLSRLRRLARLELGSLKGLHDGIAPALLAPALEELMLIRAVAIAPGDAESIRDHPTLERFDWFAEDVPLRIAEPMLTTVDKPKTRPMHAWEWFNERAVDIDASNGDLSALSDPVRAGAIA